MTEKFKIKLFVSYINFTYSSHTSVVGDFAHDEHWVKYS